VLVPLPLNAVHSVDEHWINLNAEELLIYISYPVFEGEIKEVAADISRLVVPDKVTLIIALVKPFAPPWI